MEIDKDKKIINITKKEYHNYGSNALEYFKYYLRDGYRVTVYNNNGDVAFSFGNLRIPPDFDDLFEFVEDSINNLLNNYKDVPRSEILKLKENLINFSKYN